jgi:SAM-dependent methyltransferase
MTELSGAAEISRALAEVDFSVVTARYDEIASEYDSYYSHGRYVREDRIVAATLARLVEPGDRVLDLGCGTGKALELLPIHSSYVGIDVSAGMLAEARLKFPNGEFHVGLAENLPILDESIDFVVSTFGSLSHVQDANQVVGEIARVLAPGGRFCIMLYGLAGEKLGKRPQSRLVNFVPRALPPRDSYSIPAWLYSQKNATDLFASKFDSVRVQGLTLTSRESQRGPVSRSIDRADRFLSRVLVNRAHTLIITGKRARA